ncbi:MAG TPA: SDR family NAD(P)-dependent oxidoreductase [Polyangiales bacterium]|nr:SDR family NAD(P)-dependent oxidoreductase [Polyangiales bacterium]
MAQETVVVTGGAGFIGSHTVEQLLRQGCRVVVVDDFSSGKRANLAAVKDNERLTVIEADVSDGLWGCLASYVQKHGPVQRIIHLAAQTSVVRSVESPLHDLRANYTSTMNIADFARRSGAKRMVFASSAAIYGDVETVPVRESVPAAPLSPYGLHKLASEQCLRYHALVHNVPASVFRFFNVYGPRQDPNSPYTGVISIFINRSLQNLPLTIFGDGAQTRDFVFVGDIARMLAKAALSDRLGFSLANLGTGNATSVTQLAKEVVRLCNSTSTISYGPARAGEIKHSLAAIDQARELLDYAPEVALAEGLEQTVNWYRSSK